MEEPDRGQDDNLPTALLVFESPTENVLCERRIRSRSAPGGRRVEYKSDSRASAANWSSPLSARYRLLDQRAARVKVYKNGDDLSPDKGIIYSPTNSFVQILSDVTMLLALPQKARELYSKNGDLLTSIEQLTEGMIVIVTCGERFSYKKYLHIDEYNQLPRACKFCRHFYHPSDNRTRKCLRHTMDYSNGTWLCCGHESRSMRGCKLGYHVDPKYDEDLNTLAVKKYVCVYSNGIPVSGKGLIVEIPSKFEVFLESCTRKLNLPTMIKNVYTEKGIAISRIDQFVDGMNVVVSVGDRFRWSTYLTQDELKTLPRVCSRCKANYTAEDNYPTSCRFHSNLFHSAKGYWLCCRKRNNKGKTASGCQTTFHFDTRFIQQDTQAPSASFQERD